MPTSSFCPWTPAVSTNVIVAAAMATAPYRFMGYSIFDGETRGALPAARACPDLSGVTRLARDRLDRDVGRRIDHQDAVGLVDIAIERIRRAGRGHRIDVGIVDGLGRRDRVVERWRIASRHPRRRRHDGVERLRSNRALAGHGLPRGGDDPVAFGRAG